MISNKKKNIDFNFQLFSWVRKWFSKGLGLSVKYIIIIFYLQLCSIQCYIAARASGEMYQDGGAVNFQIFIHNSVHRFIYNLFSLLLIFLLSVYPSILFNYRSIILRTFGGFLLKKMSIVIKNYQYFFLNFTLPCFHSYFDLSFYILYKCIYFIILIKRIPLSILFLHYSYQ